MSLILKWRDLKFSKVCYVYKVLQLINSRILKQVHFPKMNIELKLTNVYHFGFQRANPSQAQGIALLSLINLSLLSFLHSITMSFMKVYCLPWHFLVWQWIKISFPKSFNLIRNAWIRDRKQNVTVMINTLVNSNSCYVSKRVVFQIPVLFPSFSDCVVFLSHLHSLTSFHTVLWYSSVSRVKQHPATLADVASSLSCSSVPFFPPATPTHHGQSLSCCLLPLLILLLLFQSLFQYCLCCIKALSN